MTEPLPKAHRDMRIVFLGTPDFALPSLRMLIQEKYRVVGVFTQPDKPVGRRQVLQAPPVKTLALPHGIPVVQISKIRGPDGIDALSAMRPDLMVTAAFGQILSQENLDIPKLGCANVHGSLLPKYRGASPVQQAVIDGERETGVTIMLTDAGIDTGDILLQKRLDIGENETAGELFDRAALLGAQALREMLETWVGGGLKRRPQDHAQATFCGMLKKESARIDWQKSAAQIHNLVRGCNPWPAAFTQLGRQTVKIWATRFCGADALGEKGESGEILQADVQKGLFVQTGHGYLEICELQEAGKKRMDARSYLRGHAFAPGERFQ